jgi:enoyl-CoA hydratase/carnithine racemase
VRYSRDGKVGVVTLARPEKLNALNTEMRTQLAERFAEAESDQETSIVILNAEGRSFCVGYDIGGEADPKKEARRHDALLWQSHLHQSLRGEMLPWDLAKPVIASVQGHALGGGCEIAMFCDITIAADNARFGEPEVRFSTLGPAMIMPFIIGHKRARELLYSGDMIDAATALDLGMVNRIAPLADLAPYTMKYAQRLAHISPEALAAGKRAINRGIEATGFRDALAAGVDVLAPLYAAQTDDGRQFDEIRKKDGLGAALKWRAEHFKE